MLPPRPQFAESPSRSKDRCGHTISQPRAPGCVGYPHPQKSGCRLQVPGFDSLPWRPGFPTYRMNPASEHMHILASTQDQSSNDWNISNRLVYPYVVLERLLSHTVYLHLLIKICCSGGKSGGLSFPVMQYLPWCSLPYSVL